MKKRKLRNWMQVCVFLSLVLVLVGCSTNDTPAANQETGKPANTPTATEGSATATPEPQQPLELNFFEISNDPPPVTSKVKQHLEERTNTKLNFTWIPSNEHLNRLNVMLATGDVPDIFRSMEYGSQVYTSTEIDAINNGLFHDLTDFIKAPDFKEQYPNLGTYPEELWEKVSLNGKIYAVPRQSEPETFGGIWVRKDIADQLGLADPTTMDELADYIIALSSPPDMYGLDVDNATRIGAASFSALPAAFTGSGPWNVDAEGNFQYQEFMPEYRDYLAWLKKLFDHGAIHPEFSLGQANARFMKGTAAVWPFRWHALVKSEIPILLYDEVVPKTAEAKLLFPVKGPKMWSIETNKGFNSKEIITNKIKKEDIPRVLAMLDFMASPEGQHLAEYGIEGVHHTVVDGKIVKNDEEIKKEGAGFLGNGNFFAYGYRGLDYWIENQRGRIADEESLNRMIDVVEDTYAKYEEAAAQGFGNPQMGLYSPTMSEWDQLTRNLADNRVKVVMGVMSLDQWDSYVEQMRDSEIYKQILKEYKESYLSK